MKLQQSVCFIVLLPSFFFGCTDSDDEARARPLSEIEFRRRISDLATDYKSDDPNSQYLYDEVEIDVEDSFSRELAFLHHQKPLWEKLTISSNDPGLNSSDIDSLIPIANLKTLWVPYISPNAFERLHEIESIEEFYLRGRGDFGKQLRQLKSVSPLKVLGLSRSRYIHDNCHKIAMYMPNLTWIDLTETDIADEDLSEIAKLKHLEYLHIGRTSISAKGIDHLKVCTSLKIVFAYDIQIDSKEFKELPFTVKLSAEPESESVP